MRPLTAVARDYLLVGVTGGIGSGKSAVCEAFERKGRFVLSADAIARDLTMGDATVQKQIRETFGPAMFTAAGNLDRKALAAVVFHDSSARERLDRIVHPRVFDRMREILSEHPHERLLPYTIVEAALIYESGMDEMLDFVLVVDAPEEERIRRTIERDRRTREEVLARISTQMSVHRKRQRADFIIENSGSLQELAGSVAFLDVIFRSIAQNSGEI